MKTKYVLAVIALLIASAAFALRTPPTVPAQIPPEPKPIPHDWSTFQNDQFGFEVSYPNDITPEQKFSLAYYMQDDWRSGATTGHAGTPIVAIPVYRVKNAASYPRYFTAEVRIGASVNVEDVAHCYDNDQTYRDTPVETVNLNGTEFKKFDISSAAMMQYLRGTSYRTIRNGACIAIEAIETGSSYRDDFTPNMTAIDARLDAEYAKLHGIVETFRLTSALN